MSQQDSLRLEVGASVDNNSIQQANRAFDSLENNAANYERSIKQSEKTSKLLTTAYKSVGREADRAAKDVGQLAREFLDEANAAEKSERAIKGRNDALKQGSGLGSKLSNSVGQGGSALGQISGAAGAFGSEGVSQAAALGQGAADAVEGVKGLTTTIASLGPVGIAAGVAVGAVVAAVVLYKTSIKEQEEALKSFVAASAEFVDFAASGGTTEEAVQRQAENVKRIEVLEAEKLRLEQEYAERRFNIFDRFLNDGEEALANQVKEFDSDIRDLTASNERYQEAIKGNELAANDSVKAQEKAASASKTSTKAFESAANQHKSAVQSQAAATSQAASKINSAASSINKAVSNISKAEARARSRETDSSREIRERGSAGYTIGSIGGFKKKKTLADNVATKSASDTNNDLRNIYEERERLIKDFNEEETSLKAQAQFDQKQDLERFRFDQNRLLEQGNFTQAFRARQEKAFSQGQDRDRLQFDANNRMADMTQALFDLNRSIGNQRLQVSITPSTLFGVQVQSQSANLQVLTKKF